jgi:hypothetical protein
VFQFHILFLPEKYMISSLMYYIMLYPVHLTMSGIEFTTLVVIGTDCTGSCKSNYHTKNMFSYWNAFDIFKMFLRTLELLYVRTVGLT